MKEDNGFGYMKAMLMGMALGAAAVFFSNEDNRKRLDSTIKNWKEKVEEEGKDLKKKGQKALKSISV